ncbi:hypothetical protein BO70DRAFT_425488 [Aspergillus heteromorphus CBS 117.55]|uniref:Uncharacterized protein n=1 Tax=Aspergillus heteromorphus CBS 117.55 TaxID=1448321 RepID=A0A317X8C8_9EURO|nr:uncharacterized protein BO70DRAFT_425488 [Aspergillus heteromorphus CBS 117.55]PWY92830.1 hypothetical protein BO70DRAFT_425488 [Aspergillus heteromorphus CBS 117.55]
MARRFRWKLTSDEHRCISFFERRVRPSIVAYLDCLLWQRLVLQISQVDPAAFHALVAFSAMYADYETRESRPFRPEKEVDSTWNAFALDTIVFAGPIRHSVDFYVSSTLCQLSIGVEAGKLTGITIPAKEATGPWCSARSLRRFAASARGHPPPTTADCQDSLPSILADMFDIEERGAAVAPAVTIRTYTNLLVHTFVTSSLVSRCAIWSNAIAMDTISLLSRPPTKPLAKALPSDHASYTRHNAPVPLPPAPITLLAPVILVTSHDMTLTYGFDERPGGITPRSSRIDLMSSSPICARYVKHPRSIEVISKPDTVSH